ncbi:hypothetical protein [Chitinophaga sp.]|uniref:hypothetical protein n=1 Tax=Chitinophaga sp. TaxID=1869181 RepID=UPI0031DAC739
MNEQVSYLDSEFDEPINTRAKLLPKWMKVFSWLFILSAIIAIVCLVLGLLGKLVNLALYGLQTTDALSGAGLLIIGIYLYKGVVAIGLLGEQDWAVDAGLIDAVIGIVLCIYFTIEPFITGGTNFSIRLELVLLGLFFWKLIKMRDGWKKAVKKG